LWRAIQGKHEPLRTLSAYEAITDGIDRAVEEGKPVYIAPGDMAFLSGTYAPMTINGMNILRYTARHCIRRGADLRLIVPWNPDAMPLIDGIYREVCVEEGKPEAYDAEKVRYYGDRWQSWSTGTMADISLSSCSLLVMVGAFSSAGIYCAAASLDQGALVIAGTPRYAHQASSAVLADYPLFCEDIYGAGALCSEDPVVASSMLGGDVVKLVLFGATILFAVLALAGLPVVTPETGWFYI
jgi:hypothetical protein